MKKTTEFTSYNKEPGDNELNKIITKYHFTINKINKLNNSMDNLDVEKSTRKAKNLFNNYTEYRNLQNLYSELLELKKSLIKSDKSNVKLDMLINYIETFLQMSQTGDIIPLNITTNTKYGNLVEKILEKSRAYGKKKKTCKRKPRKNKKTRRK